MKIRHKIGKVIKSSTIKRLLNYESGVYRKASGTFAHRRKMAGVTFETSLPKQIEKTLLEESNKNMLALIDENSPYFSKKQLLKTNLNFIEVEVFSYCNRNCWFCPNSMIDRRSENIYMSEELYLSILKQLQEISFRGTIAFSRYNEPLADRIILKRIEQARQALPQVVLHTNTNGDYLNDREYLDELARAGLNKLYMQCYLKNGEKFEKDNIISIMKKKMAKIGLEFEIAIQEESHILIKPKYSALQEFVYQAIDFNSHGVDRGGTISSLINYERSAPCFIPFSRMYIDFNGAVMPCCNFRSDVSEHQKFILGDLNESSMAEIFSSSRACKLRKQLCGFGKKLTPCGTCKFGVNSEVEKTIPELPDFRP